MTPRLFLLWPALLVLLGIHSTAAQAASANPPNIVFIFIDDMGWSDLPVYGNQFHETPRIDRLAREA